MTGSNAESGFGTQLLRAGYHIAELTNLSGLSMTSDPIDVTSNDSDDSCREYIAGIRDGGELSIEGNFILTDAYGQVQLKTDMLAGTRREFEMVFPMSMGASWVFNGDVTAFDTSAPIDDKVSVSATIKVSGKPTLITTQSTGLTTTFLAIVDDSDNVITLSPALAGDTYEYTGTALTAATGVNITPVAAAGVILIDGTVVATTAESGSITLGAAGTKIGIWVSVKEAGKSSKIYKLTIMRASA